MSVEYQIATALVNKLRYFDPKGDECLLCGICNQRYGCDYDNIRSCKKGIMAWVRKVMAEKPQEEEEKKPVSDLSYYERHKEEVKARNRAWQERNKEKFREMCKKYYHNHKEAINEKKRSQRVAVKECI